MRGLSCEIATAVAASAEVAAEEVATAGEPTAPLSAATVTVQDRVDALGDEHDGRDDGLWGLRLRVVMRRRRRRLRWACFQNL